MGEPKVSIVVAIYNGQQYIDACLKGILGQTYRNTEIILVDDGSTDNGGKMCDDYAKKDDRIKVIHQENGGLSAARNAGTKAATGDYVVYFDVDDEVTETLVEDNVKLATEHDADVVMYCFWYHNVDMNVRKANAMSKVFAGTDREYFDKYLIPTIDREVFNAPWNKLYKMDFLRKNDLHFYPEFPIYEDIIFASKVLQYAEKIVVNPKMYYVYYVKSTGSLITRYFDGYFDSVTRFYHNAMDYCGKYDDNLRQRKRFATLYMRLVTTNLKQISCRKSLDSKDRLKQIIKICNSDEVNEALSLGDFHGKKKFTACLIRSRKYHMIQLMYRFLNFIHGGKMK
jgi:glycosyltransferase involved in cell wall biosynthesis